MKNKVLNYFLLLSVTGLVLFFSLKDNYEEIISILKTLNKGWLLVGFLLIFSYWFFKAIALKTIVKKFKEYLVDKEISIDWLDEKLDSCNKENFDDHTIVVLSIVNDNCFINLASVSIR